jgi:hypothetical protein
MDDWKYSPTESAILTPFLRYPVRMYVKQM